MCYTKGQNREHSFNKRQNGEKFYDKGAKPYIITTIIRGETVIHIEVCCRKF